MPHKPVNNWLHSVNQKKIFSTLGSDALDKYDISNLVKLLMYGLQVEYSTKMFKSRMYNGKRMSLAEGCIQNRTFGYRNKRDEGGKNMTYIYEPEAKTPLYTRTKQSFPTNGSVAILKAKPVNGSFSSALITIFFVSSSTSVASI